MKLEVHPFKVCGLSDDACRNLLLSQRKKIRHIPPLSFLVTGRANYRWFSLALSFRDLLVSAWFKPGRLQSFHKLCTMPVWVKSCSHGSSGFPYKKWHCSLTYFLCNIQEFFRLLEDHKAQLGVTDLQMGLTTLEEVFLTITKQADLENAAAEGRVETLTVDGQTMNVRPMFGVFGMMFWALGS